MVLKNKNGQMIAINFMLGILIIFTAIYLAPVIVEFITSEMGTIDALNSEGLDCQNETATTFKKAQCVITDITMPAFIISLIIIGASLILNRIYGG